MTEPENAHPPRKRKWLRRAGWLLLGLIMLLALAHRPLLIFAIRTVAIREAARENVRLSVEIEGNLWTGLIVKNLRAMPIGNSPVESISIERLHIRYNLPQLFRTGVRDFVTGYDLRNASLMLTDNGTEDQKQELANILRNILQQPAFFSDRVLVENFNLVVKTRDGAWVAEGVNARLDPTNPGFIRASQLTIPKIGSWRDLKAPATYIDRHLVAHDFNLGKEVRVKRVELDGSQRARGINYLSFEGTVLGGDLGLFLWRRELKSGASEGQLTASVKNLPLATVHDFLRWTPDIKGLVTRGWIQISGNPVVPSHWEGSSSVQVENGSLNGLPIARATSTLTISGGIARLDNLQFSTAGNRLSIRAERRLPDSFDKLFASNLDGTIQLDAPELRKLHPAITTGSVRGNGRFNIENRELTVHFDTTASGIAGSQLALQQGESSLELSLPLRPRTPDMAWFEGLRAHGSGKLTALRSGPYALDSGSFNGQVHDGILGIDAAELRRGPNTIRLTGSYDLPTFRRNRAYSWADAVGAVHFTLDAPSLAAFNAEPNASGTITLRGALTGSGELRHSGGELNGFAKLEASDLVYEQFAARRITVDMPIENSTAIIRKFQLDLNGKDQLAGDGSIGLQPPFAYNGSLAGSVHDLSIFQPILRLPLAGSLQVDWHGAGEFQRLTHSGEGQIALRHGRVADFTGIEGELAGTYSPDKIEVGTFRFKSDQGSVQAGIRLRDQRLQIDQLRLAVGKTGVITGGFSLPLDLRTPTRPETIFPRSGPLAGTLNLEQIDLAKVFPPLARAVANGNYGRNGKNGRKPEPRPPQAQAGPTPQSVAELLAATSAGKLAPGDLAPKGLLNGTLTGAGTLGAPEITLKLQGRNLQTRAAEKLPPAAADVLAVFQANRLTMKGSLALAGISPLQFTGDMPLDVKKAIEERRIDPATPLAFTAKLPPSSAAVLAQFVPQIRYVEGRMSVDASIGGTVGKLVLAGGAVFNLPAIRFQNVDMPGVGNFQADLRFSENELQFRRFAGDVAGGPFAVSGRVRLDELTNPQLDLRMKSEGILLVRNDTLTLRADSDLQIVGPLSSAQVTGKVGFIKSRFFREIEILPIGLPGHPTAKAGPGQFKFSMDVPPFRNWTFDIAIKTKEPFVFRSNLASGTAQADLHLGGNGLAPTLEGTARFENFVASLPFSRLEVQYGNLYFSPDNPFDPRLDIHGTSRLRDYNVNVYIYGTASEPQTLFTSEPPLPQEELIALLATGATSKEFTENNQVLASRAGVLLLQDLYRKAFKRKTALQDSPSNQVLDRFHLDVGTVDPRTGRQEIGGRFKLSDQYEVGAGVDVQGDVQLQFRYLLRFR